MSEEENTSQSCYLCDNPSNFVGYHQSITYGLCVECMHQPNVINEVQKRLMEEQSD
jgi:hypothetical protein